MPRPTLPGGAGNSLNELTRRVEALERKLRQPTAAVARSAGSVFPVEMTTPSIVLNDSSGNGHDGLYLPFRTIPTLVAGLATSDPAWRLSYDDGATGYGAPTDPTVFSDTTPTGFDPVILNSFAIVLWTKLDSAGDGNDTLVGISSDPPYSQGSLGTQHFELKWQENFAPAGFLRLDNSTATNDIYDSDDIADITTIHCIGIDVDNDGDAIRFYLDGSPLTTVGIGGVLELTEPLISVVGGFNDHCIHDELAIFPAALGDTAHADIFAAAAGGVSAYETAVLSYTPVNYYHFNDVSSYSVSVFKIDAGDRGGDGPGTGNLVLTAYGLSNQQAVVELSVDETGAFQYWDLGTPLGGGTHMGLSAYDDSVGHVPDNQNAAEWATYVQMNDQYGTFSAYQQFHLNGSVFSSFRAGVTDLFGSCEFELDHYDFMTPDYVDIRAASLDFPNAGTASAYGSIVGVVRVFVWGSGGSGYIPVYGGFTP